MSPSSDAFARPVRVAQIDESHVHDYVSRFVFGHLHARMFPMSPSDSDMENSDRIAQLDWLKPEHLGVSQTIVSAPELERSAQLLRSLAELRSPAEMLASLAQTFRTVTEAACFRMQLQAACHHKSEQAFGADESLPLFILVVIRANPPKFSSVLDYVEQFTTRAQMRTEQGYALTQASAALSFLMACKQESDRLESRRMGGAYALM